MRDVIQRSISIHAPREGSDGPSSIRSLEMHISIHAPREGSDFDMRVQGNSIPISIHAPREGSDRGILGFPGSESTISIHAPREGSDVTRDFCTAVGKDFNPRSP